MTSNVGSQQIQAFAGRPDGETYEAMKRQVTDQLRGVFRPEFLNRIDEVIVFHALTDAELTAIADLQLADLQRRIAGNDLVLELTPAARALIVREGTDPAFGARPLKRTIQRLVENPFARALLSGAFKPGDQVVADADPVSGTLVFSTASQHGRRGRLGPPRRARAGAAGGRRPPAPGRARTGGRRSTCRRSTSRQGARAAASSSTRAPGRPQAGSNPSMRFDDVLRRLDPLPKALPDGPPSLVPVLADTGGPRPRPAWDAATSSSRPAAVLVLLFPAEAGDARIVLTERTDRGGHHSGEVSFPGGQRRAGGRRPGHDRVARGAEEVGLDAEAEGVRVLGTLPERWIPRQQLRGDPRRRRGPASSVDDAAADGGGRHPRGAGRDLPAGRGALHVEREIRGWRVRYAAYPVDGLGVWGMTAMVLGGLGAHLRLGGCGPLGRASTARQCGRHGLRAGAPELRVSGPAKYQASSMARRAPSPSVDSVDRSRRTDDRTPKDRAMTHDPNSSS